MTSYDHIEARTKPRLKSRATGVFGVIIGLLIMGIGIGNVLISAGLRGEPGTLTVQKCWTDRSHRSDRTICEGNYRSQDGDYKKTDINITTGYFGIVHEAGSEVPFQRLGGEYHAVGWRYSWLWVSAFFAGVLFLEPDWPPQGVFGAEEGILAFSGKPVSVDSPNGSFSQGSVGEGCSSAWA